MAVNPEWGRRLRAAKRDFEKSHDTTLTFTEIGKRVAAVLARPAPFAPTSARSWFVDGQEPETFAITAAIARVLECEPASLIPEFGDTKTPANQAGVREIDVVDELHDQPLSDEDIARARAAVAAKRAKEAEGTKTGHRKRGNGRR